MGFNWVLIELNTGVKWV